MNRNLVDDGIRGDEMHKDGIREDEMREDEMHKDGIRE